jgi:flagellar basal-body rod modification protein FlgD
MDGMTMSPAELLKTRLEVESFNKTLLQGGKPVQNTLGKDDFLKLLIVQLEKQDPTSPLEDKEFISQMAQFSSLEQMTEMNRTLSNLIMNYKFGLASSLLGKEVEVLDRTSGGTVSGTVSEISFGEAGPNVSFNGLSYSVDDITKVTIRE